MPVCFVDSFEGRVTENWKLDRGWQVEQKRDKNLLVGKEHNWAELQRGEDWTNYSFRSRLKLFRGIVHLNYRLSEEGRYFIGFRKEGLYLKKEAPWGEFFDLADSASPHDLEVWHDVEIVGDGGVIRVYVDGILEIDYTDDEPLTSGSIAFETLEGSNLQVDNISVDLLAGKAFPDLTLALWNVPNSPIKWISPYPPLADQLTTISIVVKNVGIVPVEKSFSTELYLDGKLKKTWRFSPVLEEEDVHHAKHSLMPGGSVTYDYSEKFSEGKHTFRWVVDSKNEISESDESKQSNELESSAVFLTPSDLPDLIVDDIYCGDALVFGQEATWKIRIKNIGKTAVTVPFLTSLKADGVQFKVFSLDYLGVGDTKTFETKQIASYAGTETITGIVDVGGVVLEKDENNNTKTKQFTTSYVDLEVANLVVKPQKPTVCEEIEFLFTVKNNGPGVASKSFKISVFPGVVASGMTKPLELTFPKDKLPLKGGQSVTLQHKFSPLYAGDYEVWIKADSALVYKEKKTENNTLTAKIQIAGMLNGRLLDPRDKITAEEMQCYITKDPSIDWFRKKVAMTALDEAKINQKTPKKPPLCGQGAKDRYGVPSDEKWCSEFAAWVFLKSGMKNIRYCSAYFLWCWNYVYLDEVSLNKELVKLFDRNGKRFKWRMKNQVSPQTAEVGIMSP